MNYSEGLIWQQALWMFGPQAYGDIRSYPFLVFEYPPIFHLVLRALGALGMNMLAAGRGLSVASTLIAAMLMAWLARRMIPEPGRTLVFKVAPGRMPIFKLASSRMLAFAVTGLLPFTLLPVLSWSPLLRVDMLGLAFTYAGIALTVESLRRPRPLYAAMLFFVLACYTRQTFVAAPCAALLAIGLRDRVQALRAGGAGLAVGLAVLAILEWMIRGGFLRHVLSYNINRFSVSVGAELTSVWLLASPMYLLLVLAAVLLCWTDLSRHARRSGWLSRLRGDDTDWVAIFMSAYLVFSTVTLLFAGKSGASINYFIEWLCLWCIWIGWLCGRTFLDQGRFGALAVCVPLLLVVQIAGLPTAFAALHAGQLSGTHATAT